MRKLLEEVRGRVLAPGPFASWRHEASNQARPDLPGNHQGRKQQQRLPMYVEAASRENVRRVAFAVMQNLYPIVEAIDTDAGQYLAQATEALRKVGADV